MHRFACTPNGLSIDSNTCTISGTPTVASGNTTYTITANISNVTYQEVPSFELTPSVEGAEPRLTCRWPTSPSNTTPMQRAAAAQSLLMQTTRCRATDHTCTILVNGDLKCWGNDGWGQLGNSGANQNLRPHPRRSLSARAERPCPFQLNTSTPAPSSTTAIGNVGVGTTTDNWALLVLLKH